MQFKRTIYCSHATVEVDQPVHLADIIGASARNNGYDGITGILVFADGVFIQLIEGPRGKVDALMVRIRADKRHRNLNVLGETTDNIRLFDAWSMETPRLRPEHKAALITLTEHCEQRYDDALALMQALGEHVVDQRRQA